MKLLPNVAIKLLLIVSLILITDLLQTKSKEKFKSCTTATDCKAQAEHPEICEHLPSGEGICILPGEEFTKNLGKSCKDDDACPSALLCEGGSCKMLNTKK